MKPRTNPILQHPAEQRAGRASLARLVGLFLIVTAGCVPAPLGVIRPTIAPSETGAAETPTIVWFPPTETELPPTAIPPILTPEKRPGVGDLLFEDSMTSNAHWDAAAFPDAAAIVSKRGLTISVQPGAKQVVSMHRSAVVDDAYMEITARPSLCRDRDAYGLVFRAPNDVAHYRYSVICDGNAAAQRISLGRPYVLQPPTPSADVPLGAPGQVRLGVWASGRELRFFLNDHYQFTVTDGNYLSGGVGVFVEPGGETAVVVTFSDIAVYRLAPQSPETPTP